MNIDKYIVAASALLILASVALVVSADIEEADAQQQVARKQTFRLMQTTGGPVADVNPYNPAGPGWLWGDDWMLYQKLVSFDMLTGDIKPLLAENWYWVNDGNSLEVKLFDEAHFRDGSPVTAEDVAFSQETQWNPKYGGTKPDVCENEVEVVDEKTLRYNLKENYNKNRLAMRNLYDVRVVPKSRWNKEDGLLAKHGEEIISATPNFDNPEAMNASGPYTYDQKTPDRIVLRRVDDYWGDSLGRYYLPKYLETYFYGSNESAIRVGYQNYDCEWGQVGKFEPEFFKELSPRLLTYDIEAPPSQMFFHEASFMGLSPNLEQDMLRQNWLRKALQYATNQKQVVEKSWKGTGVADPPSWLFPDLPNYDELVNKQAIEDYYGETTTRAGGKLFPAYSPDKAVEILSEHAEGSVDEGWTYEGQEIGGWDITSVSGWTDVNDLCTVASSNWEEIGIDTQTPTPSYTTWESDYTNYEFDFTQRWAWTDVVGVAPIASSFQQNFLQPMTNIWTGGVDYQKFWTEEYPETQNTADEVEELTLDLYSMESGSEEYLNTVKELQSIIVPQQPWIHCGSKANPVSYITDRWSNFAYRLDPHEHRLDSVVPSYDIKHTYPVGVSTTGFSLADETVEPGESTTAEITVANSDSVAHRWAVYVRKGPAKPGPGPEVMADAVTTVPANGTEQVSVDVSIDEEGIYTLTVDDWRVDKWDPGEPKEVTLEVESAGPGPAPENVTLEDVSNQVSSLSDDLSSLQSSVSTLSDDIQDLNDTISQQEDETGASTTMVMVSMVVTIIVVLGGVYALMKM